MIKKDLTNKKFGKLIVIKELKERKNGKIMWICDCECGNKKEVSGINLTKGITKSCGCLVNIGKKIDLSGKKSGRLTATKPVGEKPNGMVKWLCECECGNTTVVDVAHFNSKQVQSCGCLRVKDIKNRKFGRLTAIKNMGKKNVEVNGSYLWLCQCECGKCVEVNISSLVSGHTKSCGCIVSENATKNFIKLNKTQIGKNHPTYKVWITDEERAKGRYILGEERQQKWSKEILERDDYTCTVCLKRGGSLAVHHLDGWNWCKEKRFDKENVITLCKSCHMEFHKCYGKGDNTKEQFEEYINKVLV